jgi:tripartite-type tricarboxylate transporter receptor subunit TctC
MTHPILRRLACAILTLAAFTGVAGPVHSQDYPSRPVRVVVPFPPGGGGDVLMRPLGKKLSEVLGQPVVVDNRGGANGNIGAAAVAKSAPDGYTLLLGNSSLPISATLYEKLTYDPAKDLTMIGLVSNTPSVLVVHPSVPARNMAELVALAKAQPGKLNFGSAGAGSTPHLSIEQLKTMAGVDLVHVPYNGSGPAVAAVLAGDVQVLVSNVGTVLSQIRAGRLRALGVTSAQRVAVLPDVPTIGETVNGYESRTWYALMGPANLPPATVTRLNSAIAETLRAPDVRKQLQDMGYEPESNSSQAMTALFREDIVTWQKVIKASGTKVD